MSWITVDLDVQWKERNTAGIIEEYEGEKLRVNVSGGCARRGLKNPGVRSRPKGRGV